MHGRLAHHGRATSKGARISCSGEPVLCASIAKGTAGIGGHHCARPAPEVLFGMLCEASKGLVPPREARLPKATPPPSAAAPATECRRPLYAGPASCLSSRRWSEPLSMLPLSSVSLALVQATWPLAAATHFQKHHAPIIRGCHVYFRSFAHLMPATSEARGTWLPTKCALG